MTTCQDVGRWLVGGPARSPPRSGSPPAAATTSAASARARCRSAEAAARADRGELTISNWPGYIDRGRRYAPSSRRRPASRSSTSRTSTTTSSSSASCSRSSTRGFRRPRHVRGHRLDGEADVRPRLPAGARPRRLPNVVENLLAELEEPAFDPERKFSVPWQGGMTGIWCQHGPGAGRSTSIKDLFDPKYKGKVTMLTRCATPFPWSCRARASTPRGHQGGLARAIDKIGEAADSGQIRGFTGNEYTEDLTSGNVVAAIGWSGDAIRSGRQPEHRVAAARRRAATCGPTTW